MTLESFATLLFALFLLVTALALAFLVAILFCSGRPLLAFGAVLCCVTTFRMATGLFTEAAKSW